MEGCMACALIRFSFTWEADFVMGLINIRSTTAESKGFYQGREKRILEIAVERRFEAVSGGIAT